MKIKQKYTCGITELFIKPSEARLIILKKNEIRPRKIYFGASKLGRAPVKHLLLKFCGKDNSKMFLLMG